MMNRMIISVTLSVDREHLDDAFLDFNLTVDDEYIHPVDSYIDPAALVASAAAEGEYFIFTCSCGDPACVGIDRGIVVGHDSGHVRWKMRNPLAWPANEPLPDWAQEVELVFERDEYLSAVKVALDQAKALIRHWNGPGTLWVGPGDMPVEMVLDLDIADFSSVSAGMFMPGDKALH
ncbi:hypothetical protein [Pseudodesulfovibrio senegalensis]|nr:hypothetical protein [Pseudodesulfovibrio senegalensis]